MSEVSALSMTELREELGRRGLPKSGKKSDLVARLEEARSSDVPSSPTIPDGLVTAARPEASCSAGCNEVRYLER